MNMSFMNDSDFEYVMKNEGINKGVNYEGNY